MDLIDLSHSLVQSCAARGLMVATAESCTGGMIAAALTDIPGSSAMFDRGFVTYSNEAKQDMLGVAPKLIAQHGAVSGEVARAMAEGALVRSKADVALSVTGIAGPGGGSEEKPVGTVWFGLAVRYGDVRTEMKWFDGDRVAIREAATQHALHLLVIASEKRSNPVT